MLNHPKVGQEVELRYAKSKREVAPYHGMTGVVVRVTKGKPRNHLIRVCGRLVVVPAGQLFKRDS